MGMIINPYRFGVVDPYGPERVLNGGFDSSANWVVESGITISGGKLVFTSCAYGNRAAQTYIIKSGKTYLAKFTISDYVSGSIRIELGLSGSGLGTVRSGNGTFEQIIVATSTSIQIRSRATGTTLKVDDVSIKEIL